MPRKGLERRIGPIIMNIEVGRTYKWGDYLVQVIHITPIWINFNLIYKDTCMEEQVTIDHFLMHLDKEYEFYGELEKL